MKELNGFTFLHTGSALCDTIINWLNKNKGQKFTGLSENYYGIIDHIYIFNSNPIGKIISPEEFVEKIKEYEKSAYELSILDVQHLVYYGKTSNGKVSIDDDPRRFDLFLIEAFNGLPEKTRKETEDLFWERIRKISCLNLRAFIVDSIEVSKTK